MRLSLVQSFLMVTNGRLLEPITTLRLDEAMKMDQFLYFHDAHGRKMSRQVQRSVKLNGKSLGYATISLPHGEDVWLCPYFEPHSRTLKFRQEDGRDAGLFLNLSSMAQSKSLRYLLHVARAEGLLDKVPGMPYPRWTREAPL